ncbi:MAG: patatin-like phospholipase family protein [Caldilineales bacterium]|nr:patatin-like phospholipase family protein [Caldilineales bacterium]
MTEAHSFPQLSFSGPKSKTALVLAGGGLTGTVYEIGALRAIDELLVNSTVGDFDIIVGTSAGALVGSMLAKGFTPGEMMQLLDGSHPNLGRIQPDDIFSLNTREFFRRGFQLPNTFKNALMHYLRHQSDMNLFDVFWSLIEVMPSGLYDNRSLEKFVTENLELRGVSNSFRDVQCKLYIIATDLDSGERIVLGHEPWQDVPISRAVAASSAVPLLYRPVRIGNTDLVDGGLRGTASLDLAIEAGAKLIVCINPLVPIDNTAHENVPLLGPDGEYVSEKGLQAVGSQVLRIMLHSGLDYHIKQLRRRHPDVDIILIEPRRDDYKMFFYNIMRYSARVTIARHGFESITVDLANQYPQLKSILARHGLEITRRFVIEELQQIRDSNYDIEVIRNLMERSQRRKALAEATPETASQVCKKPVQSLRDVLADLERVISAMETTPPEIATANMPGDGAFR